jgi:hypothetical protein
MTLIVLLLLDPSSYLHPRGPGCTVPGDHTPSAAFATAIPDRGSLFITDDPAGAAECGESAGDEGAQPLLGGPSHLWPRRWDGSPCGPRPSLGIVPPSTRSRSLRC